MPVSLGPGGISRCQAGAESSPFDLLLSSVARSTELAQVDPVYRLRRDLSARLKLIDGHSAFHGSTPLSSLHRDLISSGLLQLDRTGIVDPGFRFWFRSQGTVQEHLWSILGCRRMKSAPDRLEAALLRRLALSSAEARASDWRTRLGYAIQDAVADGWAVLLATLTVRDDVLAAVSAPGARHYRDYIRAVDRRVQVRVHGSRAAARRHYLAGGEPDALHFCVVEHGEKTGRFHLHVVHMLRQLPAGWEDPNAGRRCPSYVQVEAAASLWPWGFAYVEPVRVYAHDHFGALGWRWPVHRSPSGRSWLNIPARSSGQVAGYLAKYLTKQEGNRTWRVRTSRNLGLRRLLSYLEPLSLPDTVVLAEIPLGPSLRTVQAPMRLLKKHARLKIARMRISRPDWPRMRRAQAGRQSLLASWREMRVSGSTRSILERLSIGASALMSSPLEASSDVVSHLRAVCRAWLQEPVLALHGTDPGG